MVISSKFLDALTPSSIRSITAKIRDKAKDGIQVVSFAGGLPSKEFSRWRICAASPTGFLTRRAARLFNMPPLTATIPCVSIWWSL